MKKTPHIFLSYSRKDAEHATALERALKNLGLRVWRDEHSITAGKNWFVAIENGIREARRVVVLITPTSVKSEWVTYEYALATGARIPVVGVAVPGSNVPSPMRPFQIVEYSEPHRAAEAIENGIRDQARSARQKDASTPRLVAKLQEHDGELVRVPGDELDELGIDLWVERAPRETTTIAFEILDRGVRGRKWTLSRARRKSESVREFLADDIRLNGDVEIWARGFGRGHGAWSITSGLYEALAAYHISRPKTAEIRRGLEQIRYN